MSITNDNVATDYGSRFIDESLGKDDWARFEKNITEFEKQVLFSLKNYANCVINGNQSNGLSVTNMKYALGNYYYLMIRNKFMRIEKDNKFIELVKPINVKIEDYTPLKNKKQKNKMHKRDKLSVDEIREKNSVGKLNDAAEALLEIYKSFTISIDNRGFASNYIEFVGMTFIFMSEMIIKNKERFIGNVGRVWELMVSMQRFINMINENYTGSSIVDPNVKVLISSIFCEDIVDAYRRIEQIFPFNGLEICRKVPELLVTSPYDKYVSTSIIKPRAHQMEIVDKVYTNFKNGFFIVYNSMINSGKTTSVVSLTNIAKNFNKILLCVCNLQTVRDQMCCMFNNCDISFAIASMSINDEIKISKSWSAQRGIETIVCGLDVAVRLIENNPEKYIVFHDEPTIGADVDGSMSLRSNVNLLMCLPKWIIFSSATSPTVEELSVITDRIKKVHPTIVVDTVYSPTVQIACEVRTNDGDIIVPYLGCKTSSDVLNTIRKIQDIPFLGRMLTPEVAICLWTELIKIGVSNVPDIPVLLKDVNNIRADKIRVIVLEMLNIMSSLTENQIETICSSNILSNQSIETKNEINRDSTKFVNLMNLGTTEVWKGMTLIVSTEPFNYIDNFSNLLNHVKNEVKSADNVITRYNNALREWSAKKEKIMNNLKMTDVEKANKEQEVDEEKPMSIFPDWGQIATIDHVNKYNKGNKNIIDVRANNNIISFITRKIAISKKQEGNFVDMTKVSDDMLLLLFCGVGIYAPSDKRIDQHYTNLVMELASTGNLAYVIGDNSITFGTNHPYGRTIIDDKFSDHHSVYTLFQLMGRAGRVGKFPKAESIISPNVGRKLIDFTINPEKYNIEIENITKMIILIEKEKQRNMFRQIEQIQKSIDVSTYDVSHDYSNCDDLTDDYINSSDNDHNDDQNDSNINEVPDSWESVEINLDVDSDIMIRQFTEQSNNECDKKWNSIIHLSVQKNAPIVPLKSVINKNKFNKNISNESRMQTASNNNKYQPPHMRNKKQNDEKQHMCNEKQPPYMRNKKQNNEKQPVYMSTKTRDDEKSWRK